MVKDKHSHIIQQIVSRSPFFSIWALILVPLKPASSLNLTEIPILKIVHKSASSLFGLLKEMYETEKDFHCQVYIGMYLLGERNQSCGYNMWGETTQEAGHQALDGAGSPIPHHLCLLLLSIIPAAG